MCTFSSFYPPLKSISGEKEPSQNRVKGTWNWHLTVQMNNQFQKKREIWYQYMSKNESSSWLIPQMCPFFHYDVIKSTYKTFDDLKNFTRYSPLPGADKLPELYKFLKRKEEAPRF